MRRRYKGAMQLNKTTDYAVRIVVFLSGKTGFISSDKISNQTHIPKNYTRKILRVLMSKDILEMKRGVNGGFKLNKSPREISLYEIFTVMEPSIKINQCLDEEDSCSLYPSGCCPVRNYYILLQQELEDRLKRATIETLLISGRGENV